LNDNDVFVIRFAKTDHREADVRRRLPRPLSYTHISEMGFVKGEIGYLVNDESGLILWKIVGLESVLATPRADDVPLPLFIPDGAALVAGAAQEVTQRDHAAADSADVEVATAVIVPINP
jgi:hypothetical protein